MPLTFDQEAVAAYVSQFAGKPFVPPYSAFGIERAGQITGGFVFNNYVHPSIELSLAGRATVSRTAWRSCLDYAFNQLAVERLGITVSLANAVARKLAPKAGFVYEGPLRAVSAARFSLIRADLPAFRERWGL